MLCDKVGKEKKSCHYRKVVPFSAVHLWRLGLPGCHSVHAHLCQQLKLPGVFSEARAQRFLGTPTKGIFFNFFLKWKDSLVLSDSNLSLMSADNLTLTKLVARSLNYYLYFTLHCTELFQSNYSWDVG